MPKKLVCVVLKKRFMSMYIADEWDKSKYPDYMFQAAEMGREHFKDGWHLVYAQILDELEDSGEETSEGGSVSDFRA